jgi:uncharacterized glyoxalase superfamily protein PhnB
MKPAPKGWPRLSAAIYYDDARAAIDWLVKAFGFEVRLLVEGYGGKIEHSELLYGEALVMIAGYEKLEKYAGRATPSMVGGLNTMNLMIFVDDADAHMARARAAGATILEEPKVSDYGEEYWSDKTYYCRDPGGHHWWFCQRLRTGKEG